MGSGTAAVHPPVVTDVGISLFLPRAPWPLTHRAMHATGVRSLFFSDTTSCAVVVASQLKKEKMYWYVMRLVCPSVCVSVCLSVGGVLVWGRSSHSRIVARRVFRLRNLRAVLACRHLLSPVCQFLNFRAALACPHLVVASLSVPEFRRSTCMPSPFCADLSVQQFTRSTCMPST